MLNLRPLAKGFDDVIIPDAVSNYDSMNRRKQQRKLFERKLFVKIEQHVLNLIIT